MTTEEIIKYLSDAVNDKQPINPTTFLDYAIKLNVLLGDEQEKLFNLQQSVAVEKQLKIMNGESVAGAEAFVETTEEYKEMKNQEAKINRIQEFIRLSKIQSKLRIEELKGY